jgi:hypothetical protein
MAKRFDPKAQAKKQKIVLAVLGVVLLGVLVFQAPTILGLFGGSSTEVASEPASSTSPAPAAPAAPAPGAATPAAPPAAGSAELVDSDVSPQPTQSQLVTFDRFESKDPFAQQAEGDSDDGGTSSPAAPNESGLVEEAEPAPEPPPSAPNAPVRTATISVNGVPAQVGVAGTFPEGEPIFKLVSLTKTSAKVGIVDGTYATGSTAITLKKGGKPVTLMNTADGTTYVLRLVSIG